MGKLFVHEFINAHDTYTIYGSRLSQDVMKSMQDISTKFVDIHELQKKLGEKIASDTQNEAAYITNGSSSGVLLCACVCMTQGDLYTYRRLPEYVPEKNEIIVMKAQRNAYDTAIKASGASVIEVGDADETLEFELRGSINYKTAGIFYFLSDKYKRGSMPLEKVIEIGREYDIPVVVDAAACLPPKENLWGLTKLGADMVIFSGGKTLKGPMDSGFIVGKKCYIDMFQKIGFPNHGICRSSKTSKEAMVGLYTAIKEYLVLDEEQEYSKQLQMLDEIASKILPYKYETYIVHNGPVGQKYPRLFVKLLNENQASLVKDKMYQCGIYIGSEEQNIYISPLNLTDKEALVVASRLETCLKNEESVNV